MKTCDSCGVEWVYKTGVDIKDHWYEYGSIMFCEQCHSDGKADELAMEKFEKKLEQYKLGNKPT